MSTSIHFSEISLTSSILFLFNSESCFRGPFLLFLFRALFRALRFGSERPRFGLVRIRALAEKALHHVHLLKQGEGALLWKDSKVLPYWSSHMR